MSRSFRISIRLKFLISLLLIVTTAIGLITFSMWNLYHQGMKVYARELSSVLAQSTAQECRSLLIDYADRLRVCGRIMCSKGLLSYTRTGLIEQILDDSEDHLVAMAFRRDGGEVTSFHDPDDAGLDNLQLQRWLAEDVHALEGLQREEIVVENVAISEDLPALALAVSLPLMDGTHLVIRGLVRLDELQRLTDRGRVFDVFLFNEGGNPIAQLNEDHIAGSQSTGSQKGIQRLRSTQGATGLQMDQPDASEFITSFANVGVGGLVVGVRISQDEALVHARDLVRTLIGVALGLLVLSTLASVFESRRITKPVEKLTAAAWDIGKGRFDVQVEVGSNDEMATLAGSFNQMATELQRREEALKEAQAQLVQSEKMAAFGQLGAGIAHEVKNPLAGILGCTQIALRKVEEGGLKKNLELIERETRRCKTIVENLLKFAREDKVRLEAVDLNQVVKDAIAIVKHQLLLHKVKVSSDCAEDVPYILGSANQLQQVLMNLMINAQQAMEGRDGSVTVSTRLTETERVEVKVTDTGPGIPPEMEQRVFEPFFTTKPGGKGTGLGLSVSYGIIKEHKGDIHVESRPGEGCTFVIMIPIFKEGDLPAPDARVA